MQIMEQELETALQLSLTVTGGPWVWVVPSAVCLAPDDSLALVVIPGVAYEHHYGVVLVLSPINEPPPPVLHGGVADVRAGHGCKAERLNKTHLKTWICFNICDAFLSASAF